jgi:Flp pilus assembly protein TadG
MKHRRERGSSIVEFSLMTPWLIFMFIAAMDWGFYAYALIATEAAARVACLYTSSSAGTATDSSTACTYALGQLQRMSNVSNTVTSCSASPVVVTATYVASGADTNPAASVTVVYTTPVYIPMLGEIPRQLTITKTVQMRIGS